MSNVADSISGHRTDSNETNPIPVNNTTIGNNWNGYDAQNANESVAGMLVSPETKDFRPVFGSEMDLMGAGAYSSTQNATSPQTRPSSTTYYWMPGIKRNSSSPYEQSSFDHPAPRASSVQSKGAHAEQPGWSARPLWGSDSPSECLAGSWQNQTGQSGCIDAPTDTTLTRTGRRRRPHVPPGPGTT